MALSDILDVDPIINAAGPVTRLSGSLMSDEVIAAMQEAAQACYDIAELQAAAGRVIAEVTDAEAGYVTSGAAAGAANPPPGERPRSSGGAQQRLLRRRLPSCCWTSL